MKLKLLLVAGLLGLTAGGLQAQLETGVEAPIEMPIETPRPKIPHPNLHLDRSVWLLGGLEGASETLDGISSYRYTRACWRCIESDPLFFNQKPGWGQMAPMGLAEGLGAAYFTQRLRHSDRKSLRMASWLVQPTFSAWHLTAGIHNLYLNTNECRQFGADYHEVGHTCTNAPLSAMKARK